VLLRAALMAALKNRAHKIYSFKYI
jgi:hypothetical protein